MNANPVLGVFLHAIGGLAAASFYVPYKRVRNWAWQNYWLAGGFFSWIIAPWVISLITVPGTVDILRSAPRDAALWAFLFGILWGIGGLTFGLSMRYLGIALGYAIALGFCAAFGTLMPPLFKGEFGGLIASQGGRMVLLGVFVCLVGIAISGMAGSSKEKELPKAESDGAGELNFSKGMAVAVFSGILSASMAYALSAAKPIAALAVKHGADSLWQNGPAYIIILAGGFLTNAIWCLYLMNKNKTLGDFSSKGAPAALNLALCAVAGTTWYLQFMFYGMGTTRMGKYDFSSWTLHMSAIIVFSTLWGIALKEWKGTSPRTHSLIAAGLAVLCLSWVLVGYGNYLGLK